MSVLRILKYPNPRLRLIAQPVTEFDGALQILVNDLFETMYAQKGCGLAATQVDVHHCLLTLDVSPDGNHPLCLINPVIVARTGKMLWEEGCLSLPGLYAKVPHDETITVQYQDVHGNMRLLEAKGGLLSACIQHEIDHLEGKVFLDHLSPLKQARLLKKMEKLEHLYL